VLVFGTLGISLLAGAGFTFNCMVERGIDARMARTRARPAARGAVSVPGALAFAGVLGGAGAWLLLEFVNPLTMWLTLATFVGYAVVYTVILKPATPQNIVIGGASGAMPPLLGWTAVANEVTPQALVLFLIVFVWTPPHFWALALYRIEDYRRSGLPMLPVTHGPAFTRLQILLYTVLLLATTLLPFMIRMSGWLYLVSALVLGGVFVNYAWRLWRNYSDALARRTFRYSIFYLAALFAALLLDHWL
jgi:protoheme IX farnesyltransferase